MVLMHLQLHLWVYFNVLHANFFDHPQPNKHVTFSGYMVPLQLTVTTALIKIIGLWITFILLSQQWSYRTNISLPTGQERSKFRSICTYHQPCFATSFMWALYWEWSSHRWKWRLPTYHICWVHCHKYNLRYFPS